MTTPRLLAWAWAIALCQCLIAADLFRGDYSQPRRLSASGPNVWEFAPGRLGFRGIGREAALLANIPDAAQLTVRTQVTVHRRVDAHYAVAALVIGQDGANHWRLQLVESPNGSRYIQLLERHHDVHQAQRVQGPTRLVARDQGDLRTWQYDRRYTMTLRLSSESLAGEVTEQATGRRWQRTFLFGQAEAVRSGRPGLTVAGFDGFFGPLWAEGPAASRRPCRVNAGPRGRVVVLSDPEGLVATPLAEALRAAGYGVSTLTWDELDNATFDPTDMDLLVLADALRLPHTCKRPIGEYLRQAGRLLAIGAPAFSEVLAKAQGQWVTQERYSAAAAAALVGEPVAFQGTEWRFGSSERGAKHTATRNSPGAFSFAAKLQRYFLFDRTLAAPCPGDRNVLVFEAKGDAQTPQFFVECIESDKSRWVAAIDLTPEWRPHVLAATDFRLFQDSPAGNRAGSTSLSFHHTAVLRVGVARGHTPKCAPGPHGFHVRGIRWASRGKTVRPDFSPAEIEGLSPSYKLYPLEDVASLAMAAGQRLLPARWAAAWRGQGFAPLWRPRGRGFDRARPWRQIPLVVARDGQGRSRGALVSLMVGDHADYAAVWASIGVADPREVLRPPLAQLLPHVVRAVMAPCLLLDGGCRFFSYRPDEPTGFGATVANLSRSARTVTVSVRLRDTRGKAVFDRGWRLRVGPCEAKAVSCTHAVSRSAPAALHCEALLTESGRVVDRIAHRLDRLHTGPAGPDTFVRTEGSHFYLGRDKWFPAGVNFRPNFVPGSRALDGLQRSGYDAARMEDYLDRLDALGVNFVSAVQALRPAQPDGSAAYRDMLDFLSRCHQHGKKVFYYLPWADPFRKLDLAACKDHIRAAGIRDHPAILAWELAWEPIYGFRRKKHLPDLRAEWTRWLEQRYGSARAAFDDWAFEPAVEDGLVAMPTADMCRREGPWTRSVAAFRRFYSDYVSQLYRDICRDLRAYDPRHLLSFRGGACGLPCGDRFAHIHSVGVAKHLDFLCPEGYSLQTAGLLRPTPADDLRRGGLVTLYYRFVSRDKPVVWMEFGYPVNGFHTAWTPGMVRVSQAKLREQAGAYEGFYRMFTESGARGAAAWWLPGGYRVSEGSDFGVLNPDGTERPCCEVMHRYLPKFAQEPDQPQPMPMALDLDARPSVGWQVYSSQYLELVKAGHRPHVRTEGTGTTSANTPLVAVGNVPCNGHNPPKYLNAEFNTLALSWEGQEWHLVADGQSVDVPAGACVRCRASVGNLGEATWLAADADHRQRRVFLAGRREYGLEFAAAIARDTPYLGDAHVEPFVLVPALRADVQVSFEMQAKGRAYFGERRRVRIRCR